MNREQLKTEINLVMEAFLEKVPLDEGDLVVLGGSSSEVQGGHIGKASSTEIGEIIISAVLEYLSNKHVVLAVQCCEHLNRALVIPKRYAKEHFIHEVNAIPRPIAGGSFATAYWNHLEEPCLVEHIQAVAGIDIGDSFIGMHLRPVAVPVRLGITELGFAHITAARSRLKRIGGERAIYQED